MTRKVCKEIIHNCFEIENKSHKSIQSLVKRKNQLDGLNLDQIENQQTNGHKTTKSNVEKSRISMDHTRDLLCQSRKERRLTTRTLFDFKHIIPKSKSHYLKRLCI